MKKFGLISSDDEDAFSALAGRGGVFYAAMMDNNAMWDPVTIEKILHDFPEGYVEEADLFLVLTECIANAALHGQAKTLGLAVRERAGIVLFSFVQFPPMHSRITVVLHMARKGQLRQTAEDLPGGLGFPILINLARNITVSGDLSSLRLWFKRMK
ncbi:MAG: hypothetical protein AB7S81_00890 [Bdellovibrionales bacterium]